MGKRDAPLTFITTTAGIGRGGIAWELYRYALAIEQGWNSQIRASSRCSIKRPQIATGSPSRSGARLTPRSPAASDRSRRCASRHGARARARSPANLSRRLYLNNRLEASMAAWIDMGISSGDPTAPVSLGDFEGRENFMGIDMASVGDLPALVLAAREGDG